ncbi:hypothetical protein BH10ACT3_BH10ACT3_22340 [soil metagenome]
MSAALLLALSAVTLASRVVPMIALHVPRGRTAVVLGRLPAPLFAALAATSLAGGGAPDAVTVVATIGAALGAARTRTLAGALIGGLLAYSVASVIW